jgi:hypothetical protein
VGDACLRVFGGVGVHVAGNGGEHVPEHGPFSRAEKTRGRGRDSQVNEFAFRGRCRSYKPKSRIRIRVELRLAEVVEVVDGKVESSRAGRQRASPGSGRWRTHSPTSFLHSSARETRISPFSHWPLP